MSRVVVVVVVVVVGIDAQAACDSGGVRQQRHLVNDNVKLGRAAARSGEWAQHFSNASFFKNIFHHK